MNVLKFVFSQLISFLNMSQFNDFVRKYKDDYYVKHFTCWNQLLVMIFGQLSNRESLHDLIVALETHQQKCYHMGMSSRPVTKTTLVWSTRWFGGSNAYRRNIITAPRPWWCCGARCVGTITTTKVN